MSRQRPSAGTRPDDDHVVVLLIEAHLLDAFGQDDAAGRLDQREMGERLRHVAQMLAGLNVELLREQSEWRADTQQPLHQVARLLHLSDDRERGDQPERADQESTFLPRQAVVGLVGAVSKDEPVLAQFVADGEHGCTQTIVVVGQEPEDRRQQDRGVQRIRLVVLAEHSLIAQTRARGCPRLISAAVSRQVASARRRRGSPANFEARSIATQHISFDET